jgi:hypothetical protein
MLSWLLHVDVVLCFAASVLRVAEPTDRGLPTCERMLRVARYT